MTAIITKQRFNWMGYNGTESEEIDTNQLRSEGKPLDNYNYEHRLQAILEMKERLYLIKRDLDLIPEEQLRAEEDARERRRAERHRREEEERLRKEAEIAARAEEERERQEAEARRQKEEEERLEAERRNRKANNDGDSRAEERLNAILASIPRTSAEINNATEGFAKGTRMILASSDNSYVSYLDGSVHFSASKMEEYNTSIRDRVIKALEGTSVLIPAAEKYALTDVHAANEACNVARKKLDAFRVTQDPTYSSRIRSSEKDAAGNPAQQLAPEECDEPALLKNFESAKKHAESVRKAYNAKATSIGNAIASTLCSHCNSAY